MNPNIAGVYIDSSALVKLYLPEPESDKLDGYLRGRSQFLREFQSPGDDVASVHLAAKCSLILPLPSWSRGTSLKVHSLRPLGSASPERPYLTPWGRTCASEA